ncbi:unnamed protein product, partial [marine sediment metagenome]
MIKNQLKKTFETGNKLLRKNINLRKEIDEISSNSEENENEMGNSERHYMENWIKSLKSERNHFKNSLITLKRNYRE